MACTWQVHARDRRISPIASHRVGQPPAAALSLMDAGHVTLEPFTSYIDAAKCCGCGNCERTCPYHAIEMVERDERLVAWVNEVLCKGCGTCVAACLSQAAMQNGFSQDQIVAEIVGIMSVLKYPIMPQQEVV